MGEFLALALLLLIALGDEVNRCCKDWLKSMVTFKKKSQTDKFFPNSLADLYLKLINHYTFILQSVKSMSIVTRNINIMEMNIQVKNDPISDLIEITQIHHYKITNVSNTKM